MKRFLALVLLALLSGAPALADWDPVEEARRQAERDAEKRKEDAQRREIQKQHDELKAKYEREVLADKRKSLGAAAAGKSDAEVARLYDEKIKNDTEAANKAAAEARKALGPDMGAAKIKQGATVAEQMTGKTIEELGNMTEEEAAALEREMMKKYGQ